MENKIRLCRIATVPFAFNSSIKLIEKIHGTNIDITIVSSPVEGLERLESAHIKEFYPIHMAREIAPLKDLISLFQLILYFRKQKFDIVHSNTPKGGLLVALAGVFCPKTKFIHTFTGQRWETLKGFKRKLLQFCDKVIIHLNDRVYADSKGQARYLESLGMAKTNQIKCVGEGSFGAIDLDKFNINNKEWHAKELRQKYNIKEDDKVIVFLGRIVKDKGIVELVLVFKKLCNEIPNLKLVLVGPFEDAGDPIPRSTKDEINSNPNIITTGFQKDVEKYLCLGDVLALPSYREGFPTVVLEAAALEIPAVVADVVGSHDTVIQNETGFLFNLSDLVEFELHLKVILTNENRRIQLAKAARQRVVDFFSIETFIKKYQQEYKAIKDEKII